MEKKPFLTEAQAQEILQDVPTPFHVYDEKGIRENARRINKAFSWNKGFREYFAVKALPNPVILQILKEEGCGVDCSSLTELMLSEVCGFTGSDIMFSSNQTPVEDMKKAYELGAYINLDDATMVDFLDRVAGVPENIFCRYNPGGTFQLGESEEGFQVMDKPGDAKYGMTEEQMIESYKKLMQKGAKNFGIHAFLASNTISDAYYPELAGILFQLAVRVQKATGAHIAYINLSGGVGIPYRPDQTENDIMAIGEGVRKKFEEILVPAGMGDVAIFTEMGRFTTGPYGALVATAIHEKHIYKEYIGLDACAANLMRPAMYGAYHHITVLGKEHAPCDHKYDVVGGLCENNDKFAIDRMLPKIDIGDLVYHPRHRCPRFGHGLQLQRQAVVRRSAALRGRLPPSHPPCRDPARLLRNAGLPALHEAAVRGLRRLNWNEVRYVFRISTDLRSDDGLLRLHGHEEPSRLGRTGPPGRQGGTFRRILPTERPVFPEGGLHHVGHRCAGRPVHAGCSAVRAAVSVRSGILVLSAGQMVPRERGLLLALAPRRKREKAHPETPRRAGTTEVGDGRKVNTGDKT